MISDEIKITYIGGPTALLEVAGIKFLTDPTFDPALSNYKTKVYVLHKLEGPKLSSNDLGKVDFVLLSHDHHFDNLDREGRNFLSKFDKVFTTTDGAKRLNNNAVIVPLHFEGREHFREPGSVIKNKFEEAGLIHRLRWAK